MTLGQNTAIVNLDVFYSVFLHQSKCYYSQEWLLNQHLRGCMPFLVHPWLCVCMQVYNTWWF